jgi:hypothetical protein
VSGSKATAFSRLRSRRTKGASQTERDSQGHGQGRGNRQGYRYRTSHAHGSLSRGSASDVASSTTSLAPAHVPTRQRPRTPYLHTPSPLGGESWHLALRQSRSWSNREAITLQLVAPSYQTDVSRSPTVRCSGKRGIPMTKIAARQLQLDTAIS